MSSLIPINIPGCQVWLDANDPNANSTPGANGGAVSTWNDKSGNSRNMILTGSGVTYANAYQNSLNAISLNGTAILGKIVVPSGTFSSNYCGFIVYRNTRNSYHAMFARTDTTAWGLLDLFSYRRYSTKTPGSSILIAQTNTPDLPENMSLFNFGYNNYAATGNTGTYNEYYNGTSATYTDGQRTGLNATDWNEDIYFVGRAGVPAEIQGHYCEIIIYNTNLTESQRQQIEGYLAWKWGIQSSLPNTHPFYLNQISLVHPVPFTYLALDSPANTGSRPQLVAVNGSVTYPFINNLACARFNNSSANYLSVPFTSSPQFTISYWFYAIDGGTYDPWSLSSSATGGGGLGINPDIGNGTQHFYIDIFGSRINPGNFALPSVSSAWHHITLSVDTISRLAKSYLNGVFKNSATGTGPLNTSNTQHLILGKDATGARAYNGYLRNFSVFNTVLTDTQVNIVYKASLPIHTIPAPLILLRGVNYTGGNTWADNSGYGRVATLEGGTAAINASNNAIVLNGSTSWTFSDVGLGNAYSASVWIKPTDISTWSIDDCILTQTFNTGNGERKVPLSIVVTGTTSTTANIAARFWTPTSYQNTAVSISNNTWVHIVVTWNRTNMTTYLNGVQAATSVIAASVVNGTTAWRIGRRWDTANYIKGEVGEVSLYKTPMTADQVTAVYNRGLNDIVPTAPPAITAITFTYITQTSFVASWAGAYGATSCAYTLNGASITPSFSDPYLQTATFTGLTPLTTYLLGITATNATGSVSSSESITTASPPPTALAITSSSILSTSFVISWTGGEFATSYRYKLNTISLTPTIDNGVASKTATFTGLSPSTIYVVEVTAANYVGTAISSISVTTQVSPPVAAVVTISNITPTSFVATWTGGTNATSYTYTLNGVATTPSIDNGLTTKTATFTGLNSSTTYSLVVNPTNAGGPTPTTKSLTTLIPYPTVPVVTVTTLLDTTFTVSYSSTGTSYTYKLNGVTATPSVSGSSATFSGLTSLTTYTLLITATNTSGSTDSTTSITTLITPPTKPVVSVGSIRDTSFIATWTGGLRASSYSYTLNGLAVTPSTDNGLSGSATFTGLTASTAYALVVTAINSTNTNSSVTTNVTTLIPPPTVPVLSISPRDTSATISWTGGATATSYSYTVSISGTPVSVTLVDNGVSGKTATVSGLSTEMTYSIAVNATNGTGTTSSNAIFTTLASAPSIPVVTISSIRDTSFVATWTGGLRATSYSYRLNGNLVTPSVDSGLLSKSATFTGLTASTTYSIVVTAINSTDPTASASKTLTTLIPPPTTPAGLAIGSLTDSSFVATWTGGDVAISYTYTLNGQVVVPAIDNGVQNDNATFTGLTSNTTYILVITAVGSTGPTSAAPVSITTLPPRPGAAVISSSLIKDTSFSISWTGSLAATSYTYTLNGSLVTPSIDRGIFNKSASFTGLIGGTVYSLEVISTNASGSTPSSITIETLPPAPTVPLVTISSIRDTSFTATWTGAIGVVSYVYAINGAFVVPAIDNGLTSRSVTFTGLSPSSTCSFIVAATNPTGTTYSVASSFTTLPPAPTIPIVTIGRITALSFTATWTNSGATSYTYTLNGAPAVPSAIANKSATFTGVPNTPYSLVVIATNVTGSTSSEITNTRTLTSPTKPTDLRASITSSSFMVSWTGGDDVTSYTYLLNSVPFTPSDNGLLNQTASFLGLSEVTDYTCTVIAQNSYGSAASDVLSVRTRQRPPPTTFLSVMELKTKFDDLNISNVTAAGTAIQEALATNVNPATVVCSTLAVGTPVMFTALVNNPNFMGSTVSIPAHAASILYNNFEYTETLEVATPLYIIFPDSSYSVPLPGPNNNSKYAIDLTVDTTVSIRGSEGNAITVKDGVQYFITPTTVGLGPDNEIHVGDILPITTSLTTLYFTVADLDIVLIPYKEPISFICFLGSAPVLTPSGYRRIDRFQVGDLVKTPTGTATVEAIKSQVCEPSKYSNPYVIPEGVFGANRKLLISPRHKVSVSGHMFEARHLGLEQEVQAKSFTYYNLQITGTQNMIVAGVEVESLKPLVRVKVSQQAFDFELAKLGGMTPEIKARCRFLADGSVSVPAVA